MPCSHPNVAVAQPYQFDFLGTGAYVMANLQGKPIGSHSNPRAIKLEELPVIIIQLIDCCIAR